MSSKTDNNTTHDKSASSSMLTNATQVFVSISHPLLNKFDTESIRTFLKLYDQYVYEIYAKAKQLPSSQSIVTTDAVRQVDLKYCVDPESLESAIDLQHIKDVSSYENPSDDQVREFLGSLSQESKQNIKLGALENIMNKELHMNMKENNARSRMEDLFIDYNTILARHAVRWLKTENQKVAVQQVLSAIKPNSLHDRLESDLEFSHHALKKDFNGFLSHAIKIAEAIQILDRAPQTTHSGSKNRRRQRSRKSGHSINNSSGNDSTNNASNTPICLYEPHKPRGLRNFMKDCKQCPEDEKPKLIEKFKQEKRKKYTTPSPDAPARNARSQSQTIQSFASSSKEQKADYRATTGRLQHNTHGQHSNFLSSPSCPVTAIDGPASIDGTGRCDDGSYGSLVSPRLAESAVIKINGKLNQIETVQIQVALTTSSKAEVFSFSRVLVVPRLVLHLSVGQLALFNVSFLVPDADLSCEHILIGNPVLNHLGIDARTILERNRSQL